MYIYSKTFKLFLGNIVFNSTLIIQSWKQLEKGKFNKLETRFDLFQLPSVEYNYTFTNNVNNFW